MGLVAYGTAAFLAVVVAVLSRLIADDLRAWMPSMIERLIDSAVRSLPEGQRERYAEEWRSYLADVPGDLSRLIFAVDLRRAAKRMTRHLASTGPMQTAMSNSFEERDARTMEEIISRTEDLASRSKVALALSRDARQKMDHSAVDKVRPLSRAELEQIKKVEAFLGRTILLYDTIARRLTNLMKTRRLAGEIDQTHKEMCQSEKEWNETLPEIQRVFAANPLTQGVWQRAFGDQASHAPPSPPT